MIKMAIKLDSIAEKMDYIELGWNGGGERAASGVTCAKRAGRSVDYSVLSALLLSWIEISASFAPVRHLRGFDSSTIA